MATTICPIRTIIAYRCPASAASAPLAPHHVPVYIRSFVCAPYSEKAIFIACACACALSSCVNTTVNTMLPSRVRFSVCVWVRALLCACGERCDGKRESYYKWTTTTASSEMDGATIFNGDDFSLVLRVSVFLFTVFVCDIFRRRKIVSANELKQNEVKFNCKWTRNIENMHRRVVVVVVVAVAIIGTPSKVCAHTIFELWFTGTNGACRRTNGRTVIARVTSTPHVPFTAIETF